MLVDQGTTKPVRSNEGVESDHCTVFAQFRMPRIPSYDIQEYEYYHLDEVGDNKFAEWIGRQDWKAIIDCDDPDEQVEALHEAFDPAMKNSFKLKKRHILAASNPWAHHPDLVRSRGRIKDEKIKEVELHGPWGSCPEASKEIL